jgi:hypothetical protein
MQIKFSHGQFGVYEDDEDGRQSLVATFRTLAAAQEPFPQANLEPGAMTAAPAKQGLSIQAKWLIGSGIAGGVLLLLVLAVLISYLTNPIDY